LQSAASPSAKLGVSDGFWRRITTNGDPPVVPAVRAAGVRNPTQDGRDSISGRATLPQADFDHNSIKRSLTLDGKLTQSGGQNLTEKFRLGHVPIRRLV